MRDGLVELNLVVSKSSSNGVRGEGNGKYELVGYVDYSII